MSSSWTEQVEIQQRRHSTSAGTSGTGAGAEQPPQDVGAVVAKAKKAAASLWMILHAQVSDEQSLCTSLYICSVSISPVSMYHLLK